MTNLNGKETPNKGNMMYRYTPVNNALIADIFTCATKTFSKLVLNKVMRFNNCSFKIG